MADTDLFFSRTGMDRARVQTQLDSALAGADDGELFLEYSQSESFSFDDNRLKAASFDTSQGFGLRAVAGEATGYAHATELSEDAIARAAATVKAVSAGHSGQVAAAPARSNVKLYTDLDPLQTAQFGAKVSLLEEMNAYARAKDRRVRQVSASLSGEWQRIEIIRAGGEHYSDIRPLVRIGVSVVFHPSESLDALPHGECSEGSEVEANQTEFEDRLASLFEDFQQGGESFGVLWITVDQAHDLRKTHGAGACDAMLDKVERALANGLRPADEMGRWGDDEYLILSHERTLEMLAAHAQTLADLARTAEFRWWGDRVPVTVSIGAAQAERSGCLVDLLGRAKAAMYSSVEAGGNQITSAPGGQECSPS